MSHADIAVAPVVIRETAATALQTRGGSASTVAIVGGGASGSLVAVQLLRQTVHPLNVLIFDPLELPEIGTAYGTPDTVHLLNVPAGRMSALPEEPDHFIQWLNSPSNCAPLIQRRPFTSDDFVPRAVYARYISHLLEETARRAAKVGAVVRRIADFADDYLTEDDGSGWIVTRSGRRYHVAQLVLALGNLPPRDPLPRPHEFFRSPLYMPDVWKPGALEQIGRHENLLLAGSGLTAMDVVATLHRRAHQGHITVISRNGQIPAVHTEPSAYEDYLPKKFPKWSLRDWVGRVREEIGIAEKAGHDWRPVFDSLRRHTPRIWQSLDLADKRRFLRHVRPYWESRRHRVPPQTYAAYEGFRQRGQLEFRPGRIADFSARSGKVEVRFRPKGKTELQTLRVHRVLNCIGPESNFRHHLNQPLLVNLLSRGVIDTDPLLLGLAATAEGAVIGADGLPNPTISTLGPPLRGILWETTAIPEIRIQASFLAGAILQSIFVPTWEI